jgi:uncharacterized protein YdcH (DUF465 family)
VSATEAGLFALLKAQSPEFRRLAEKHREIDQKITAFDRIYYLTSEQERKRQELQTQKFGLKAEMSKIMRAYTEMNDRFTRPRSGGQINLRQIASATT